MSLVKRTNNWLPNIFDDMFNNDWMDENSNLGNLGINVPAVNIHESEDAFKVDVAAPGKTKGDFNIELDNNVLTISAEEKTENTEEEKGKITRREFSFSKFKRAFTLPDTVENNEISANYENGVLTINLPKKEEAKVQAKRMIEIS
ncbi:Hsp20/alpha crystallin family protein [Haloflavibacter putidus]|uniref:Hsp20/alpha crystallin family protein n=1 Tax=Haloflavibacter putidus TaxID=2576776 RepID=A0A507ZUF2_9FLAO|nr:Hsp20/alpha crystallin family protein [Haloflavibacter putidus]TQD39378.1 Hsp20/alpha crystallin family protein [Haloflavibacter putidus]